MEIVLLIILIIYLYVTNKNINSKFDRLHDKIRVLNENIRQLKIKQTTYPTELSNKAKPVLEKEPIKQQVKPTPAVETIATPEKTTVEKPKVVAEEIKTVPPIQKKKEPVPIINKKSWFEQFKDKNPDLEKFIGENLINKIGILILVLGISFFVKYAIDKNWINEPARVGIGILCGSLVMLIAHKLRKNYTSFSAVLVAGAISIFYFTIYIAFNEYFLFSQTIAFIIMIFITIFSVVVSVSYNRQELAVLSLIGGFASPFMVSTGAGNYIVLFSYIAILNIGILAISYFKKWRIVTSLAFLFTAVLFTAWYLNSAGEQNFIHSNAMLFLTLFYFIFSVAIVMNNLKNKGVFTTLEYIVLIANTFFFFTMGMAIIYDWGIDFKGGFTLLLALYNLIYASILYKKFKLEKSAVYLLIGLALTFATLTIPIQFEGNLITLFWAAEAVLLFWLAKKSKINYFNLGAIIVQGLTIMSLLMDWKNYNFGKFLPVIFNKLFITGIVVSGSLFLTYKLFKKDTNITTKFFTISSRFYKKMILFVLVLVSYFTGMLETIYQANMYFTNTITAFSFPVSYHFIFVALMLFLTLLYKKNKPIKILLIVSIISILYYIVSLYALPNKEIEYNYLYGTVTNYAFYLHYCIVACIFYFGYQLFKQKNLLFSNMNIKYKKWLPWLFAFAVVYVLSSEVMVHGLQFSNIFTPEELTEEVMKTEGYTYQKKSFISTKTATIKEQIIKIGYPILWGVFSFLFLIIGIKKQWKSLRIIALSLLGITVLKLFLYDIKNVSETGKIIAFIILGVLILVISFVYQKIKKLVVDDTSQTKK